MKLAQVRIQNFRCYREEFTPSVMRQVLVELAQRRLSSDVREKLERSLADVG